MSRHEEGAAMMGPMRRPLAFLLPPLAALALAACPAPGGPAAPAPVATPQVLPFPGPSAPVAPHTTDAVEQAACAAFAGPGTPIAPPVTPADAPRLEPNRRYDVALGKARTHLALEVPRTGEWSVFLGTAHFFLVFGPDEGVAFSVEDGAAVTRCAGIGAHTVFLLEQGRRYRLELAAGAGRTLPLFIGETHPDAP